jgi:hypothetical protein
MAFADTSLAIAQPVGRSNPAVAASMNSGQQSLPEAPVGHRQPRADQVPSEKDLMDPSNRSTRRTPRSIVSSRAFAAATAITSSKGEVGIVRGPQVHKTASQPRL